MGKQSLIEIEWASPVDDSQLCEDELSENPPDQQYLHRYQILPAD